MGDAVIVCVGNPAGTDDGAGPAVARALEELRPEITVRVAGGEPIELLGLIDGVDEAVVVDAIKTGRHPPGTVVVLDASSQPVPVPASASTHGVGLAVAVELGRSLGRLPSRLVIIGIEAADLRPGTTLTPAVAAAVPNAAERALRELTHA